MKNLLVFILLFSVSGLAEPLRSNEVVKVRMEDVVQKVSSQNLAVYQNALKVYQAKKSISVARGNLLPKLNFWRILTLPFDPKGLIDIVGDIAPFLIPSNWFQLKAQSQMYEAEKEAYKALWANEVMTAKALYVHLLFDRNLLSHIDQGKKELKSLASIIHSHEVLGGAPQGASRELEIRLLALEEDTRALSVLIEEEESLLVFMLGYEAKTQIELEPLALPNFEQLEPLNYENYVERVLQLSPELKQYDFIIKASTYVKKTAEFSLFGVTNEARGVAGGIFDNVPIQDGLGFGTPASIKIAKSQTEMLKSQKQGAEETLKRQLRLMVANYNLDLQNFMGLKKRVDLAKAVVDQYNNRLILGEEVDSISLIEASRNHIQADSAFFSAQYRFLINQDKVSRLLFQGDYEKPPESINELPQDTSTTKPKKKKTKGDY